MTYLDVVIGWTGSGLATQPVGAGDGQAAGKLGWQRTDCEFGMQPAKLKCSRANCDAHGRMRMQSGLHEAPKIAFSPALMTTCNLQASFEHLSPSTYYACQPDAPCWLLTLHPL